ncbi:sensor domain-containing diguanylate cyclase [Demequina sp. NBRC 110057]|uniref:sensor domain-containing diguanylate cyclase n=1 Tax=Demequina sp. NBRC 110057 TaxID=1570346 RepID=UPI0009FDF332|nr:sensor domain-containing diguanylate cyclase [Demequina sp. NBRC 110057]
MLSILRPGRGPRPRGYGIGLALILVVLAAQIVGALGGAWIAGRHMENAQIDTVTYVGRLTASDVASAANPAREAIETTVSRLELNPVDDEDDAERVAFTAMVALSDHPEVTRVLFGWSGGAYLMLERTDSGYEQTYAFSESDAARIAVYDEAFDVVEVRTTAYENQREQLWYTIPVGADGTTWMEPVVDTDTGSTRVTLSRDITDDDGEKLAVVAADVDTAVFTDALDDLPFGDGAAAYVLSAQDAVVGFPTARADEVADYIAATGDVPTAGDLGIGLLTDDLAQGETAWVDDGETVTAQGAFAKAHDLPWQIVIVSPWSALSDGLDALKGTIWWIAASTIAVTGLALLIAWRVRHPLAGLRTAATTDPLTGLLNRAELQRQGRRLLKQAHGRGGTVVVGVIDLDHFKTLNDRYGHPAGDAALTAVGARLRDQVRGTDIVARVGGDEFVVVMVLPDGVDGGGIAWRLRDDLEAAVHSRVEGGSCIGVTMGIAVTDAVSEPLGALVARADAALVEGKQTAKGRVYLAGATASAAAEV